MPNLLCCLIEVARLEVVASLLSYIVSGSRMELYLYCEINIYTKRQPRDIPARETRYKEFKFNIDWKHHNCSTLYYTRSVLQLYPAETAKVVRQALLFLLSPLREFGDCDKCWSFNIKAVTFSTELGKVHIENLLHKGCARRRGEAVNIKVEG